MKRQIRKNVFETNSSSVHSLVFSPDGLEKSELRMDKDGYILVEFGFFGKNYRIYDSQQEKLSYLITQCYYLNHYDEDLRESYYFQNIEEYVCEYAGAAGIKITGGEPEIDHQSVPEYGGMNLVNEWNKDSVINFVFNKNVWLKTECD